MTDLEIPDGTLHPYARDLDGVWHKRPADDNWNVGTEEPQFHSLCGKFLPSVNVAQSAPHPDELESYEALCQCATDSADTR